jgi:hypothetical protein
LCGVDLAWLFKSRDGGEKWECVFDALPPILCVKSAS